MTGPVHVLKDSSRVVIRPIHADDTDSNAAFAEALSPPSKHFLHKGLGKLPLGQLIARARTHGVTRLYSTDAANNTRMRTLAHRLGFTEQPDPDDIRQVIYALDIPNNAARAVAGVRARRG